MADNKAVPLGFYTKAPIKLDDGSYAHTGLEFINHGSLVEDNIMDALYEVLDPEFEINIVDLGLIYRITVQEDNQILLNMTLTNAACPLIDTIQQNTIDSLVDMANGVIISWVWSPAWGKHRITAEGHQQLSALGIRF